MIPRQDTNSNSLHKVVCLIILILIVSASGGLGLVYLRQQISITATRLQVLEQELSVLDRNTRNLLRTRKILHKQSNVERLYLPRKKGGRGLLNITQLYKKCIINTYHYIDLVNN